jgi:protein-disulfide isomerase
MPRLGSEEAGVVIVEFSEFQCPFCRVFWQDTMPSLLEQYVTSGEVSIVFRHLPLERIHPMAFVAAEAAECAGEQGQFWEMHDLLFARQSDLRPERLGPWALELGLDLDAFERCVSLHERAAAVRRDQDAARALGISGTPTLLIGKREAPGSVRILRRVKGAAPFGSLVALINQVTEETGPAVR